MENIQSRGETRLLGFAYGLLLGSITVLGVAVYPLHLSHFGIPPQMGVVWAGLIGFGQMSFASHLYNKQVANFTYKRWMLAVIGAVVYVVTFLLMPAALLIFGFIVKGEAQFGATLYALRLLSYTPLCVALGVVAGFSSNKILALPKPRVIALLFLFCSVAMLWEVKEVYPYISADKIQALAAKHDIGGLAKILGDKRKLELSRGQAAAALITIGDEKALKYIESALADRSLNQNLRTHIVQDLSKVPATGAGEKAQQLLVNTIGADDLIARRAALNGIINNQRAIPLDVLLKSIEDEDDLVRGSALRAIWDTYMHKAQYSSNREIYTKIVNSHTLPFIMRDAWWAGSILPMYMQQIKNKGLQPEPEVLQSLRQLVSNPKADMHVRARAAIALSWGKDISALNEITNVFHGATDDDKRTVAMALSNLDDPKAKQFLYSALKNAELPVSSMVAEVLSLKGDRTGLGISLKALGSNDFKVRYSGVVTLERIGNRSHVTALEKLSQDSNVVVRSSALSAIGKLGGKETLPILYKGLMDTEPQVRWVTARVIGDVGDKTSLAELRRAQDDTNKVVSETAARAINSISKRYNIQN